MRSHGAILADPLDPDAEAVDDRHRIQADDDKGRVHCRDYRLDGFEKDIVNDGAFQPAS